MDKRWKFQAAISSGMHYEIDGLGIWDHTWINKQEQITVHDPLYGQLHIMHIYEISDGEKTARFASGEFSNDIWAVYTEE